MTQQIQILNSKEVRHIREIVFKEFGYFLEEDYAYLQNENRKIFLVNKDLSKIDTKKLIIDKLGLYFGEINDSEFRLSKEGAQLLGREAQKNKKELKNVVSLTTEELKEYFLGKDLEKDLGANKIVLIEYNGEILGCSKYKEGKILNYLPKMHRGEVIL